jgi:starch synthase
MTGKSLKVLFLASEADPWIKVGGLGDVAGSLPTALKNLSQSSQSPGDLDIRLVLPFHPQLKGEVGPVTRIANCVVQSMNGPLLAQLYSLEELDSPVNFPVYLVDGEPIQSSPDIYSDDVRVDGRKYVFFSLAALGLVESLDWLPDVLHANDWHTSPAIYQVSRLQEYEPAYRKLGTLLTIHNLGYMGGGTEAAMDEFGLPPAYHPNLPWWARQQPLPLALVSADRLVAVSPGYAREICTSDFGVGLDALLRDRGDALSGILNGIDPSAWDPAADRQIRMQYSVSSLPARQRNKSALQMEIGLPIDRSKMLIAMVSRLVYQKGVDLAVEALAGLGDLEWQALILGTGEAHLEDAARALEAYFPDRVRSAIRYDANFSRRIYAGADSILIPSRYEPSGLTQMIGMRYGCVPIARATGGLADTITNYWGENQGTGFLFQDAHPLALAEALRRALAVFPDKKSWQGIQRRGMLGDYSWDRSAKEYFKLYKEMQKA